MTTTHGLFRDHPPPSRELLLEWVKDEGGYVHKGVRIQDIPDEGWGLITNVTLEPHELLFNIPVKAILSVRNSSLSTIPPSDHRTTAGPILDLSLCVLHEHRLERESRWYGYLQSLPRGTILLPAFWSLEELCGEDGVKAVKWLGGTEAERDLVSKAKDGFSIRDLEEYYDSHVACLPPTRANPAPSSFLAYLYAFSLVATRAFLIDLYHTIALVPFADTLNHSSSTPHTSLSSDSFVCHMCGSLAPCTHDILAPNGIPFRLQEASSDPQDYERMLNQENTVEMRMEAQALPGQVYNSYGANISDARLLVKWGYLGEEYAGDGLTWDRDSLSETDATRRAWLGLLPYRHLWTAQEESHESINGDTEKPDLPPEDRLLFDPAPDPQTADLFNLSQSGQVSSNIWVYIFLATDPALSDSAAERICVRLRQSMLTLEQHWAEIQVRDDSTIELSQLPPTVLATAQAVRALLEDRLSRLNGAEMPLDQLFELRDSLSSTERLQRMAISLCINERILLETALGKWSELLSATS